MTEVAVQAWRQYRLERRLFWRNPSAAFFNFLLPLLFLAFFGAAFQNDPKELRVIVPGIAAMSVMSTTFTALAFNMTFLREQGVLKRIRGTPMPATPSPTRRSRSPSSPSPVACSSAPAGRVTGLSSSSS
jgi:ABC-2 type transport system permease protein